MFVSQNKMSFCLDPILRIAGGMLARHSQDKVNYNVLIQFYFFDIELRCFPPIVFLKCGDFCFFLPL
jgi:hypothetical protein